MNKPGSLVDQLRVRYEALPESTDDHSDVDSFQAIDAPMRKASRWLERAITYLNGLRPTIDHKFDLGYGYVFDSPRFGRGSVGPHERRVVGFPVSQQIERLWLPERDARSSSLHAQAMFRTHRQCAFDRRLRVIPWLRRLLRDEFAVDGISEAPSIELAPLGIHATVVEPGYFRTPLAHMELHGEHSIAIHFGLLDMARER